MTPVSAAMRGRSFIMLNYFWVSLGGSVETAARFWLSGIVVQHSPQTFGTNDRRWTGDTGEDQSHSLPARKTEG
jgi:hypothetical protein